MGVVGAILLAAGVLVALYMVRPWRRVRASPSAAFLPPPAANRRLGRRLVLRPPLPEPSLWLRLGLLAGLLLLVLDLLPPPVDRAGAGRGLWVVLDRSLSMTLLGAAGPQRVAAAAAPYLAAATGEDPAVACVAVFGLGATLDLQPGPAAAALATLAEAAPRPVVAEWALLDAGLAADPMASGCVPGDLVVLSDQPPPAGLDRALPGVRLHWRNLGQGRDNAGLVGVRHRAGPAGGARAGGDLVVTVADDRAPGSGTPRPLRVLATRAGAATAPQLLTAAPLATGAEARLLWRAPAPGDWTLHLEDGGLYPGDDRLAVQVGRAGLRVAWRLPHPPPAWAAALGQAVPAGAEADLVVRAAGDAAAGAAPAGATATWLVAAPGRGCTGSLTRFDPDHPALDLADLEALEADPALPRVALPADPAWRVVLGDDTGCAVIAIAPGRVLTGPLPPGPATAAEAPSPALLLFARLWADQVQRAGQRLTVTWQSADGQPFAQARPEVLAVAPGGDLGVPEALGAASPPADPAGDPSGPGRHWPGPDPWLLTAVLGLLAIDLWLLALARAWR